MSSTVMRTDWAMRAVLRRHALLFALVAVYFAAAMTLSRYFALPVSPEKVRVLFLNFLTKVPQMAFLVLFGRLLYLTYVERAPDRIARLKADVRGFLTDGERMASALVAVVTMTLMLISFAQFKSLLPRLNPFSWDTAMMRLDQWLHFGWHPWELAHAVFGGDYPIILFTGLYNIWLFLMYFMLFGACFLRPDSRSRMQFLFAFLFTWAIGGNLVATLFSSAGPVYYALLGLGDTYAPLMDRLQAHADTGALTVVETQALLWRFYSQPDSINAISAFPSMHVASSTLMALMGFRLARWMGIALTIFTVLMLIGSVLLAWHYAVDGYVGILIALACWKFSGWLIRSPVGPFRGTA